MAPGRSGGPHPLAAILQERFATLGWQRKLQEAEIFKRWEEAVGARIARHSKPVYVRSGRLTLMVDGPAWSQQLALLRPQILRNISRVVGRGIIEDIYLTSGSVEPPPEEEDTPPPQPQPQDDPVLLAAIDRESSRISDTALRQAFRRTLLAATRRMKPLP